MRDRPNPQVMLYALERSGKSAEELSQSPSYRKIFEWLSGDRIPSFKQMCKFSKTTHIPVRYLYQEEIPDLGFIIPDFRTVNNKAPEPSPNLYDVIGEMDSRKDWLNDYYINREYHPVELVGLLKNYKGKDIIQGSVETLRDYFGIDTHWFESTNSLNDARKYLKDKIEEKRISVSISGVVPGNTHRPLEVSEFRGFVISDEYAPLIFINGKDALAAQIFTLIHELSHLLFAETGVDLADALDAQGKFEKRCNTIASEFLVPDELIEQYFASNSISYEYIENIALKLRVSFIVCARRLLDTGVIGRTRFYQYLNLHNEKVASLERTETGLPGGSSYNNTHICLGNVLTDAIYIAVKTGELSYIEAYEMTHFSGNSFKTYFSKFVGEI